MKPPRITLESDFHLTTASGTVDITRVMGLLLSLETHGNMKEASAQKELSYRHAWNLIEEVQQALGAAVVASAPGKGSTLTELGRRLVWADKQTRARLGPVFDSIGSEISEDLAGIMSRARRVLRLHASHGFAVAALSQQLHEDGFDLELNYRGSTEALDAFNRQDCDLAGFHVPMGPLQIEYLQRIQSLIPEDACLIHLATRRQGLMVAQGNPRGLSSLRDLVRPDVLFVNRQPGSGTRTLLEILLRQDGVDPRKIRGYDNVEFTHAAIGAYIASGKADIGMGVETGARLFDLDFVPMFSERYFMLCRPSLLTDARFKPVLDTLRAPAFHQRINGIAGYDATNTGLIQNVTEAFIGVNHDVA